MSGNIRVCLSFNKKLRCRLKKPSARRKTKLIAGLFTSFTTTTMAFLGTTRRGGLLFCPLCVKKTLFRMTKRQFFCLDWAKNKLRRSLLLKDKQTLAASVKKYFYGQKNNRTFIALYEMTKVRLFCFVFLVVSLRTKISRQNRRKR